MFVQVVGCNGVGPLLLDPTERELIVDMGRRAQLWFKRTLPVHDMDVPNCICILMRRF